MQNVDYATDKQIQFLNQRGWHGDASSLTKEEASHIIQKYLADDARNAADAVRAEREAQNSTPSEAFPSGQPQPQPKANIPATNYKPKNEVALASYEFLTKSNEKIKLDASIVSKYICDGLSEQEYQYFFSVCKRWGLNPFIKEIYAIKFGNQPATFVIDYKVLQQAADIQPTFDGLKTGVLYMDAKGEAKEREGSFVLPNEKLLGAWCIVYRKDRKENNKVYALYDENKKLTKDGSVNTNWKDKPVFMITKVAKAQAIREAYPNLFDVNTYTDAEYDGQEYKNGSLNSVNLEQENKGAKKEADIDLSADDLAQL